LDQFGRFTDNPRAWRIFTERTYAWLAARIHAGATVGRL